MKSNLKTWIEIIESEEKQIEFIEENKELTKAEKKEIKQEVKEILKKEEKKNTDWWIKKELTKEEKVSNFFDSIEFLWMTNKQKEDVAIKLKKESSWDRLYWIEIFLSSLIAALGLLQNSVAVVIWAMLIAPLLRPINGISFAIARWTGKFFMVSFNVLLFSVIASISMWAIVSFLIWLDIHTSEVVARSTPNIVDFFIAVFSAMVAVMSLRFTRLWESIAWVAMAAALMPPLAVVWIALAAFDFKLAYGSMMLFMANLVAIVAVATVFFWLYWFTPHIEKQQKYVFKRLALVFISIIIILVPLISSFLNIREELEIKNKVEKYLYYKISPQVNNFAIEKIQVDFIDENKIKIDSTIKIPESYDIKSNILDINTWLQNSFSKKVELDLEIVRSISVNWD